MWSDVVPSAALMSDLTFWSDEQVLGELFFINWFEPASNCRYSCYAAKLASCMTTQKARAAYRDLCVARMSHAKLSMSRCICLENSHDAARVAVIRSWIDRFTIFFFVVHSKSASRSKRSVCLSAC
jgi:hypothetical protein